MDVSVVEEVVEALEAADFPADRDLLIRAAERAGAGDEVVRALRELPIRPYRNRIEVLRSIPLAHSL